MLGVRLTGIGMINSKGEGARVAMLASISKTFSKNSFGKKFKCAVYAVMIVNHVRTDPVYCGRCCLAATGRPGIEEATGLYYTQVSST